MFKLNCEEFVLQFVRRKLASTCLTVQARGKTPLVHPVVMDTNTVTV